MARPIQYLLRMAIFLAVLAIPLGFIGGGLINAFFANPLLNGVIVGVMIIGIVYSFWLVMRLWPEVSWVQSYRDGHEVPEYTPPMVAPMASMFGERRSKSLWLTAGSMRTLLDGVAARLDEGREISRYLIGLLVFLGLLGTFWGLLETIRGVTAAIDSLQVGAGEEFADVFKRFKADLVASLGGAGTAFSTSLFGLGGSLIVGFLDLQASQAQNRFYMDMEDWLSRETRLSSLPVDIDDLREGNPIEFIGKALDFMARQLATILASMHRSEQTAEETNQSLQQVSERLGQIGESLGERAGATLPAPAQPQGEPENRGPQALSQEVSPGYAEQPEATADPQLADAVQALARSIDEDRRELVDALRHEIRGLADSVREMSGEDNERLARRLEGELDNLGNRMAELQQESRTAFAAMVDENKADRRQLIDTLRNEFRILARTLATVANAPRSTPGGDQEETVEG